MQWKDLLNDPQGLTVQIKAIPGVKAVMPILWASGMVISGDESVGVKIDGVDPQSEIMAPIRKAIVTGQMPTADDHEGILVGKLMADDLGLKVGDSLTLVINTSNQTTDQAVFIIRGLFDTGVAQFDNSTVYMPMAKAQVFSAAGERASAIRVLFDQRDRADAFAAAFKSPNLAVLTWRDLNALILQAVDMSQVMIEILYLIVLGMVAVVIANTLLMSAFERTREMGILSALGMKARQILSMFLMEAGMLGVAGVILGFIIGGAMVTYYSVYGMNLGTVGTEIMQVKASNMITYGKILYTHFSMAHALNLSATALIITLIVSLYPSWFAAHLEPVQALHGK
jgi:ABC-type lipoprotein release transport system permease subunit